ncbi:MAG: hypothetical protein WCW53_09290 [Syntrophales bacterium]
MSEFVTILKSIPAEAWVAILTALLTAGFTLLGVWITNKASNQRLKIQLEHERLLKTEELKREKLEELYVVTKKFLDTLVVHYLPFRMVMYGEINFNQALDMAIETGTKRDFEPHRVTMLIDLYYPELRTEFDKIMNIREKLNDIVDGYKEQYKRGNIDGSRWLELFQPLFEEIGILADGFDKHIVKLRN